MIDSIFVGRSQELARLESCLDAALQGQGQVLFVTGEAGSGKTTLLRAFAEHMQENHPDLIAAVGTCNAQGGIGDAYLPFREILGILTGTVADHALSDASEGRNAERLRTVGVRAVQLIVDVGPDLVGAFVPGASLVGKMGRAVVQRAGWMERLEMLARPQPSNASPLDQPRIFEQYANVLNALAKEKPLLLVLDDLHWADDASLGLLFHLSRRIEASRIVIVCTYRADEVALPQGGERQRLEKIASEIKRYAGDVFIDLGTAATREGRAFVDQLLDRAPNALDEEFRATLFQRTGGHPLFTVELVRAMQENASLVKNSQGEWVAAPALNWDVLPARVEGVIQERVGRLDESEHDLLQAASVEGMDFTAEVVAQVQQLPLRTLLKVLTQSLDKRHQLVHELDVKVEGERLTLYQFSHNLIRQYLYDELSSGERRILHGEVARALEQLYPGQADEISPQLAWHFDQAGEKEKAVPYLIRAGERALKQGAPREAFQWFDRALNLMPAAEREQRWQALAGRQEALTTLGEREAQQADLKALLALAEEKQSDAWGAEAWARQQVAARLAGDYRGTLSAGEQAIAAAEGVGNAQLALRARSRQVFALSRLGEVHAARELAEEVIAQARICGDPATATVALENAAAAFGQSGDLARVIELFQEAVEAARRTGNRFREAPSLGNLGTVYVELGLYEQGLATLEQVLAMSEMVGARRLRAYHLVNLGVVYFRLGDGGAARRVLDESLHEFAAVGDKFGRAGALLYAALAYEGSGDIADAAGRFMEAADGFTTLEAPAYVQDARAGLARCALAQAELEQAREGATGLWDYLHTQTARGMDFPIWAYLTCADIFQAAGEPDRAHEATRAGYHELLARADKISNLEWRKSFLENVPEHRKMIEAWNRMR